MQDGRMSEQGVSESSSGSVNAETPLLTTSALLRDALELPGGARFYRCALQVNPFEYLQRHKKKTSFKSEAEYNAAIIQACKSEGVEVIAVTDHYRVRHSMGLIKAARESGLFAFGGFEAETKEGVHYLCLFDPDKDESLERYIGDCGIHDEEEPSPSGDLDSLELLQSAKNWGAACIAAHVAADKGLLKTLSGKARAKVWKSDSLLACALPGGVDDAPSNLLNILKNKDQSHFRERPIAIINANDVSDPDNLKAPESNCFIKMSDVSVEGLRQAFLDPDSRIRLNSDARPDPHAEFLCMSWEGGFLDGTKLHFNENLNVLVGGRGAGKSTIVESLRYVLGLDPLGEEAKRNHESVVRHVLKNGTRISLLVRSHHPTSRCYTIERTVPNPPVVKDAVGTVLDVSPRDVVQDVEVFGQHEISELTRSPEKLTLLLDRFVQRDVSVASRRAQIKRDLEKSRLQILEIMREIESVNEKFTALPRLEETLKSFQDSGIEEQLKGKSDLVREERLLDGMDERLSPVRTVADELRELTPIDTAFLSETGLNGLPNASLLQEGKVVMEQLDRRISQAMTELEQGLREADKELSAIRKQWKEREKTLEETYQQTLRRLQKSKVDGEEFIELRRQIESLRPLRDLRARLERDLKVNQSSRREMLDEWDAQRNEEHQGLSNAAKKVTRKLKGRVRVKVDAFGDFGPLEALLRDHVRGNLSSVKNRLSEIDNLSLRDLADQCRAGKDALMQRYEWSSHAAEGVASAGEELFMKIEEVELPFATIIELNTAPELERGSWHTLDALSTGQKATAILLLLLLESEAPLIIDQPEDDLDNRFVSDGIVPVMKQEKRRRQFVLSTHNANIPVLGDAELILGMTTEVIDNQAQGAINPEHMGSIDAEPVRAMVEEVLEGGKAAFEMRRLKYGF